METVFTKHKWRFIDQSISANNSSPLESFAMDDTLCHVVGQGLSTPTIRTWVHNDAVVLGIQDHRLPYIEDGTQHLQANGYTPIVRNSGGLAVVLDSGVLNISIILNEETPLSINAAFDVMVDFIRALFPRIAQRIEAYEIIGSYCPGSYDLSIDGRKFAGISQRRMKSGIAVQIYLCVEGSGSARAELIKGFYAESLKGEQTKFEYPNVNPSVMASLAELTGESLTVTAVNTRIQQLMASWDKGLAIRSLDEEELTLYAHYLERIFKRNESLLK